MSRIFQVEYMTRPDEREHIKQFDDFRQACCLAREMSDEHAGTAVVCALDPMPDHRDPGLRTTGHIEFVFGDVVETAGTLGHVEVPRCKVADQQSLPSEASRREHGKTASVAGAECAEQPRQPAERSILPLAAGTYDLDTQLDALTAAHDAAAAAWERAAAAIAEAQEREAAVFRAANASIAAMLAAIRAACEGAGQ